ncbi:hypothetical protein [Chryseobacterium taiwanense]|uniref:Uncharacterized protein n=1 Tax=Chryseobacterium taiwanense TaxID=363331 RepID=A0A0B4EEZ1_9FLAO|nr:hypothetical protein [Chryseobacterium taiwanense]KIC65208.1 hypothetical protein RM51_01795 [Chryseobacterium taiwanense]
MFTNSNLSESQIRDWWSERRLYYNVGLIVSGIVAFIVYLILGVILIMPYDDDFEITLFTIVFQGMGYVFMMLFANLFYSFGVRTDLNLNKGNSMKFRKALFNFGFRFSIALPFLAPTMLLITYYLKFY